MDPVLSPFLLRHNRPLSAQSWKFPSLRKILTLGEDKPSSAAPAKPLSTCAPNGQPAAHLSSWQHGLLPTENSSPGWKRAGTPSCVLAEPGLCLDVSPKQQTVQSHVTSLPHPSIHDTETKRSVGTYRTWEYATLMKPVMSEVGVVPPSVQWPLPHLPPSALWPHTPSWGHPPASPGGTARFWVYRYPLLGRDRQRSLLSSDRQRLAISFVSVCPAPARTWHRGHNP